MKLRYIGLKTDGERAFQERTGIEWMPGSEHEVPDTIASEMLAHPTIWEPVSGEAITLAAAAPVRNLFSGGPVTDDDMTDEQEAIERAAKEKAAKENIEKAAVADEAMASAMAEVKQQDTTDALAGMDDAALREFAKANGLKIQGIALTKGDNLRAKVSQALADKAAKQ